MKKIIVIIVVIFTLFASLAVMMRFRASRNSVKAGLQTGGCRGHVGCRH